MSENATQQNSQAKQASANGSQETSREEPLKLRFVSHSQMFYYWPIWVFAYLFAIVSKATEVVVPLTEGVTTAISRLQPLGLCFLIIIVLNLFFVSVNVRGLWASLLGLAIAVLLLLLYIFNLLLPILQFAQSLSLFLSTGFYLCLALCLSAIWAVVVLLYDRRKYLELHPSHITLVQEVGDGEKNFDTLGLVLDKKRDNFFQHNLLGFGSGDLILTTAGGQNETIHFHNVLGISRKLTRMHEIMNRR